MSIGEECRFCHTLLINKVLYGDYFNNATYNCPICGFYTISVNYPLDEIFRDRSDIKVNQSKIASFLYYHHIDYETFKTTKRHYLGKQTDYVSFKNILPNHSPFTGKLSQIDENTIEQFYPKTFAEKEDKLLKDIYNRREVSTDISCYSIEEFESAAFIIKRAVWEINYDQIAKILISLEKDGKIEVLDSGKSHQQVIVKITTDGQKYIEKGDNKMEEKTGGVFINNGNYVNNSTLTNSTVGNANSSTNFDYDSVIALLNQITNVLKQQSSEETEPILENIEEAREYVEQKDNKHLCSRLKTISSMISGTCAKLPAVLAFGKELVPFIDQLKTLIGA